MKKGKKDISFILEEVEWKERIKEEWRERGENMKRMKETNDETKE